jgi:hypothetical protein
VSVRRRHRELARWDAETRIWATEQGRRLALDLYHGHNVAVRPYSVGILLWDGETVWGLIPARCCADTPLAVRPGPARRGDPQRQPRMTDWLITSRRVAGRLYPDTLGWWQWTSVVGVTADLTPGKEFVQIDLPLPASPVRWWGPGVAPLAVAAIRHLHGPAALLDHPGLAQLRQSAKPVRPAAEIEPMSVSFNDIGL